eukprot:c24403_g1_i2 orf=305-1471(+)
MIMATVPAPAVSHHKCLDVCPESPFDWALLGVAILLTIPFVLANGTIFAFRKRRYFQAQGGVDLILGSSVAGLIWIAVNFVINLHFNRKGHFLKDCDLWTFWLQLTFGFCLWLVCVGLRLYRLYILCTRDVYINSFRIWTIQIPLLLSPALIFSLIASQLHVSRLEHLTGSSGMLENCEYKDMGWKISTFVILPPLYFSIVVLLLFRLRGMKDYILTTEYRHTTEHSMMAFVIYLLTGVTYISGRQHYVSGRCFLTFCVCYLVFSHFWVRMWWPVYLCLFKGESEMDTFEEELRWCGAECLDKLRTLLSVQSHGGRMIPIPSSQLHDGDLIMRAIDDALVELAEQKAKVDQLEQKKLRLRAKFREHSQELINSTSIEAVGSIPLIVPG